ncbi:MAG: hypothetical protein ACRDQZ_21860 [Mycobacteriales bacterium]
MSTKMGFWRWALACAAILIASGPAGARVIDPTGVTTDEPTALVMYPRLKVDTVNGVDTIIQLTNTSEFLTKVHCFYTNANSHCSNSPATICTQQDFTTVCPGGGLCVQGWQETDFRLTLTKRQPISWSVNQGLSSLPLNTTPGQNGQLNAGNIPAAPENPFTGELLCIEVDVSTELPTDRNDFKGEATTIRSVGSQIDANKYNAIGIKAIEGAQDGTPNVLNIGGPNAEYGVINNNTGMPEGCPNVLTVDHFFDVANVVTHRDTVQGRVNSELTIVPCQNDFLDQTANTPTTIQFLVFNEFEQRFSTSTNLDCYKQIPLSGIDSRSGVPSVYSIFAVGVEGTLTGMSRLRSVAGPDVNGYDGRTILAVMTENWGSGQCGPPPDQQGADTIDPDITLCATDADCSTGETCNNAQVSTTAENVQFQGSREQGDQITIPLP